MKPRLGDDVRFLPRPDGVFVMVPSRPDAGFHLGGAATYEWLHRIGPFLTGEHTLDELAGNLNGGKRDRLRALIAVLHKEGALRDASGDLPHTLPGEVRRRYADVIGFLSRCGDSPYHRFQRYHHSDPLVVGAGMLVPPVIQTLLATGVARVRLTLTGERLTDLDRMGECLRTVVGADAQARLDLVTGPAGADHGAVLHVCETPMADRARDLARACARRGAVFAAATVVGDRALVGPVEVAGPETVGRVPDAPGGPVSGYLASPTAAVVAHHLCVAYLRQVAGLPPGPGPFTEIDLETLRTKAVAVP